MKLIYSYDKLHTELRKMIDKAEEYIYIFSWDFNMYYNKQITQSIIHATKRRTHVYLMTGGKEINPIYYVNKKYFHLKYKFQIGPKRQYDTIQHFFNFQTNTDYMFYNHMRFALNEKTFLLGGVNISHRYEGNINHNMKQYNFCWFDSGLKLDNHNFTHFIKNLFDTMDYEMERTQLYISPKIQLIHNNYAAYQKIIHR